jgi:hypothetical protein
VAPHFAVRVEVLRAALVHYCAVVRDDIS